MALPHGVVQMSADVEGLVETSTNLATVETTDTAVVIGSSQRSSVESAKQYIAESVRAVMHLAGAQVHGPADGGYPGWKPDIHSHLLQVFKEQYHTLFQSAPEIKAIHAGLECGILKHKYPQLDAISFGPNITGAHSPQERVEIASIQHFYDLLKSVLARLAKEQ